MRDKEREETRGKEKKIEESEEKRKARKAGSEAKKKKKRKKKPDGAEKTHNQNVSKNSSTSHLKGVFKRDARVGNLTMIPVVFEIHNDDVIVLLPELGHRFRRHV